MKRSNLNLIQKYGVGPSSTKVCHPREEALEMAIAELRL